MADLLYTSDLRPLYFVKKWKLTVKPGEGTDIGHNSLNPEWATYYDHDLGAKPLLYGRMSLNDDMSGAYDIGAAGIYDPSDMDKEVYVGVFGAEKFIAVTLKTAFYAPPAVYLEIYAAMPVDAAAKNAEILAFNGNFNFNIEGQPVQILDEGAGFSGTNLKSKYGFTPAIKAWDIGSIKRGGTKYKAYSNDGGASIDKSGNLSYSGYVQILNVSEEI